MGSMQRLNRMRRELAGKARPKRLKGPSSRLTFAMQQAGLQIKHAGRSLQLLRRGFEKMGRAAANFAVASPEPFPEDQTQAIENAAVSQD